MNRLTWLCRAAMVLAVLAASTTTSSAWGPGWTNASTVVRLVNTASGGVNVQLSPMLPDCVSQGGYGPTYASLYPGHPGLNRMKADLLIAFTTGAKVQLYFGDSTCRILEMILIPAG